METIEEGSSVVMDYIALYGLSVIGAIVILIVGFWFAGFAKDKLVKILSKSERSDEMLNGFLGNLLKYLIICVTILAVLQQFGIQTASMIAVMGAAGLAIGLALQGTLSNVAAGVMILFLRPFTVGNFVEVAGYGGTVKGVSLFTTELATVDNVQIILPNSQVWGSAIKNFNGHDTRRVDMVAGISYEDDIDKAMALLEGLCKADDRIFSDPAPFLVVGELADSSVNITIRVWTKASDYWGVKFDLTKSMKETFDKEGISIPYPQQVVHHVNPA